MIGGITAVACIGAAILVAFLALECFLGSIRRKSDFGETEAPAFIVLMPAHNEAKGIAPSVRAVLAQLRPCDSLVVLADNCSDDTADIARGLGATVLERANSNLRGKGYALEFGRDSLKGKTGEVVIIIDADCIPQPQALTRLASSAVKREAVVQGAYLLIPPAYASSKVRLSCFAFMIKNLTRQRGLERLSGAALLQGSGMAFPRHIFDRAEWRPGSLVEDLDMGLDLLLAGERVTFNDRAVILSHASSESGTAGQRRRWEHGILQSVSRYALPLLAQGLIGRRRIALVGVDLIVPPTTMLVSGAFITFIAGILLLGSAFPTLLLGSALVSLATSLVVAWRRDGRELVSFRQIGQAPAYLIWKFPITASFFLHREEKWIRTEREP